MTDRQAFIAAICADPDDNLPRLVFADWLDENGEPERAEFIRAQCEAAEIESGYGQARFWAALDADNAEKGFVCLCRRCTLRRRPFELLQPEWCPAVMPYDVRRVSDPPLRVELVFGESVRSKWFFTRGFVSAVSCPFGDWADSADLLTRPDLPTAQPITDVDFMTDPRLDAVDSIHFSFLRDINVPYLMTPRWPRIRFWLGDTSEFPTHALPLRAVPVSPVSADPGVSPLPRR